MNEGGKGGRNEHRTEYVHAVVAHLHGLLGVPVGHLPGHRAALGDEHAAQRDEAALLHVRARQQLYARGGAAAGELEE